ncbi:MAG: hypothetical protein AVDCRST_MAG91-1733 [uncultured Sphingomonadaceae bacterium]|uniref:SpoVT-AbrB domain-containing protein n=1 Tax=uncultured Sphingomonadaceae bacterium TaxID=169976 RepID=A0A6J4T4U6_9SPHN|nr:MAG: hypothetical protein AVDCRST_MAG91-1733 [uncultured Sphingomonadaceae bacterium]
MNEVTTKAFKAGNSVAVRFPKKLGIQPGMELRIREEDGRFIVEPVAAQREFIDLTGIAGAIPGLKPFSREEREFEDVPRDWHLLGITLP